jgi:L-iditol 2-dehydrogenase
LAAGTVVPEKIVTSIDPLEKWRDGFDKMIRGEGAKGVIVLDDSLQ